MNVRFRQMEKKYDDVVEEENENRQVMRYS